MSLFPLLGVAIAALRTEALAFDSDSQEDENVVGAETQCFVLPTGACQASRLDGHIRETTQASSPATTEDETSKRSCREESFRLGLSDSSHLQDRLQALAVESTQAFVSVEATQLYAASSHAHQTSATNESELEATQAYGEEEEPAICSVVPEREGRGDFCLESTQAYISDPYQDSEDETDDDEKGAIATHETQPFYAPTSATVPMAETQPMCASEEEDVKVPVSTAVRVKIRSKNIAEERGEHSKAVRSQERPFTDILSLAETQPMCTSDDRERDEEDSFPGQRKRKTKQLQIEDEQTQSLTSSGQALVETQPLQSAEENLAPPGSETFHEDNSAAVVGSSEALQKHPALITSDLSAAETQLMITGEDEESEEPISFLALPRQKAKPLPYLEEETQTLAVCESSVSETQPMNSGAEANGEDSLPGTGITKAKPLQILEEKAQLLTNSESSIRETRLSEAEAGSSGSNVGGTRAGSRKVSTQGDEPSRRRTRGRNKAVSAAAPRGKPKSSGEEREEEQEAEEEEHPKEAGGMKPRRQRNEVGKNEPDVSQIEKQGEPRLGEKSNDTDLRSQVRENSQEKRKEASEREEINLEIEEKERIEAKNAKLRLERERAERENGERERKEQEERAERRQKSNGQKEREDKEKLEHERAERGDKERLEREKNARMSSYSKGQEEKEILGSERREHDENLEREVHHSARQESEAKQLDSAESFEKGKITEEKIMQEQKEEDEAKVSARGRRAARRTAATEPAKDSSPNDDVPARRTRSRSNSSNSVNSERSASSVHVQESSGRGRGRGRGARQTSDPAHAVASRSSNRRRTVAVPPTQVDSCDDSGGLFSSNFSNSSLKQSSQGRGRASRQHPRGGRAEADSVSPAISQGDLQTAAKTRKNTKPESSHETEKADSQQATASRGRWRSRSNGSEAAEAEGCSNPGQRCASEESKTHVRGRSQKPAKSEAVVAPGSAAASNLDETKELRKGRKREAEANTEDDSGSRSKFLKGEEKEPASDGAEEAAQHQAQNEVPVQAKRRGRASTAGWKKPPKASDTGPGLKESNERAVEEAAERGRARPSLARKKTNEEQRDSETPVEEHARALEPEVT